MSKWNTVSEVRKQETTRKRKTPRWLLCTFKDRRRNYMNRKSYLKQLPLNDTFAIKRYDKGLLVQIKKEEVYKILKTKNSQKRKTAL